MSHDYSGHGFFRAQCCICDICNFEEHFQCIFRAYQGPWEAYGISDNIDEALDDDESQVAVLLCFLEDVRLYARIYITRGR